MMNKGYQFVSWFPQWIGLGLLRNDPGKTDWAYIYEWHLKLGCWELRKWSRLKPPGVQQERAGR